MNCMLELRFVITDALIAYSIWLCCLRRKTTSCTTASGATYPSSHVSALSASGYGHRTNLADDAHCDHHDRCVHYVHCAHLGVDHRDQWHQRWTQVARRSILFR